VNEQGIHVPIEPYLQEHTRGLRYFASKIKKESRKPSLNINTLSKDYPKQNLTLIHLELIETSSLGYGPLK
jgi:hypothetical protein